MKKITTLLLLVALALNTSAKLNQNVKNFYKSDYEFGAKNWMADQQKNGVMFFANMNGLMCFDGRRWKQRTFEGAGNTVRSMAIAQNGDIFIAAQGEFGVFRANYNRLEDYENLSHLIKDGVNFTDIWNIHELGDNILFLSQDYIFFYDGQQITYLKTPDIIKYSTVINNTLYLTSNNGNIYVMMGTNFMPLSSIDALSGKNITSIIQLDNKGLLIVTESHGAYIYKDGKLSEFGWGINPLLKKYRAFTAEKDGDLLAVGTVQNGLILYNLSTDDYEILNIENGLQNNTVLGIDFDLEHNLWLCLERGISYINIQSPFTPVFARNNPYGTGYCSYEKDGNVYLGTNQGLFIGKYDSDEIVDIDIIEETQGQVYAIKEIDGHLFCCHNNGLYEIIGNKAEQIASIDGVWNIQKLKKNPEYYVAGCYQGLIVLKKEGTTWKVDKVADFTESSRLFEQDENGDIWMAHGLKGIFRITLSEDLDRAADVRFYGKENGFQNSVHISVFDINGEITFAAEDGLYRYNAAKDLMEINTPLEESLLGAGQYYYFGKDQFNRLWMLKGQSIHMAQMDATGRYTCLSGHYFTIPEDLQYEYFNISALDLKNIIVSNEEGFTMVNLDMTERPRPNFEIYVRQIYSLTTDSLLASQYLKEQKTTSFPKIKYKDNSLRIIYGSVSFSAEKNNETMYATRLLGYEKDWTAPSKSNVKEYTNLHEGIYTIQIKSYYNNQESNYTEYTFEILPPFYRTVTAYICYVLAFFLFLFVLYKFLKYKELQIAKEKDTQLLEQQQKYEKESEAKDSEIMTLKNEQLEQQVEYQTKELAGYTMNLVRKNEILIDVKEELGKLAQTMDQNKTAKIKLNSIIRTINENIEHDEDWKKFEENFDHLHQDFIKRLSEQYSGLTINDKKLCAYLKMNLVSKDIAPLLNISLRGVEIGRYRLRKKLNLSRDTNLTEFLQNF